MEGENGYMEGKRGERESGKGEGGEKYIKREQ